MLQLLAGTGRVRLALHNLLHRVTMRLVVDAVILQISVASVTHHTPGTNAGI
jgi:hypothetical protein